MITCIVYSEMPCHINPQAFIGGISEDECHYGTIPKTYEPLAIPYSQAINDIYALIYIVLALVER